MQSIPVYQLLLFYAGISFLAMFYWLIVFIYSRRRNYLVLAITTAVMALYQLNTFQVILHFRKADAILLPLVCFAFMVLASELNGFKKNLPFSFYSGFYALTICIVVFQVLSPLIFSWQVALTITILLSFLGITGVLFLFVYSWLFKNVLTARFSFFVYLPCLIGYLALALSQLTIIPYEFRILAPIGSTLFILLLFYGMVTYVIALRTKRKREQLDKEELIRQQNILLAKKVEERTRELELEREKSEELLIKASQRQMAELELQSLRAQLNPHFMFNSLNSIQELILKEDFENSHAYLARFGRLLRMLLENTENPFTSLQKENDFLELYLSLEKLRLPDLQYSITTDACIDKEQTLIPNMILQPYIENALWHGLSNKEGEKKLEIHIYKENGQIIYEVKDNGIGRKMSAQIQTFYRNKHKSKGMELLTKRFQLLSDEFGSAIKTEITDVINDGKMGGTKVSIIVPDTLNYNFKIDLHDSHHYN